MGYNAILLERDRHVATVRLNRPDKHNAINAEMSAELIECLDAIEADDDVRVIVLMGAGEKAFCAGADMGEAIGTAGDSRRDAAARAAIRLLRVKKPTIAAVNGYAYGGGAVFAIHCDIRICSEAARFRFVGATYGLVVGASQLPRIVGAPVAKELIFTARVVEAEEAARIGLANRVVPHAELAPVVAEMASAIAANSPTAVMASKEVIDLGTTIPEGGKREMEHNLELRQGMDHRERFRAAAERVIGRGS
ncbi:MAG TPA: enoyl-CoA hydratase/isomerase family protein [Dehalococcoidia bacterium]|nr:enoyl-CoA hydratase/isomerase family protein [Dehalococcoidia bacterium]